MQFSKLTSADLLDTLHETVHDQVILKVPGFTLEQVTTIRNGTVVHAYLVHVEEIDEYHTYCTLEDALICIEYEAEMLRLIKAGVFS